MAEDEGNTKNASNDAKADESKAAEEKAPSTTDSEIPVFPTPKFVVTIVSPRIIHLEESDVSLEEWKEFEETRSNNKAETTTNTNTTVLNLHVLLVSLLNRLIRARLFPRRAVHSYITPAAGEHEWVVFSILTPSSVLPILLSKCEHFGVGNLVGLVYAVPLETCVLPLLNQTPQEEGDEEELLTVPSAWHSGATTMAPPPPQQHQQTSSVASATGMTTASSSTRSPDALSAIDASGAVLIMAPQKKTIDPTAIRPSASETFDDDENELEGINSNRDGSVSGAAEPIIRRSNSHPDVLETARVEKSKDDAADTAAEEKKRATPLLEIIPEAKMPVPTSSRDTEKEGGGADMEKADSSNNNNNKNALIQKVMDARREWLATASRIRVEQVAEEVTTAASLTIDYLLFVVCAAAIAATGLATDSSVTVLASMLVSPIMGPILAVTFGTMIRRPAMIRVALRNEAISLFLCILVGAFGGLIVWWTKLYESSDWPANEMLARGDVNGLSAGIFIALPSGMATALSTLGKNSSGLVGVAISLSLLPPAVNAGLCWMFALLENTRLVDKEPDDLTNYWRVGSTSFGLTLINIVCIWLAGVFTFWLKEVAPVEHKNAFWSRDLKIARQKPQNTGTGKIKDGLQAALDLKKKYDVDMVDPKGVDQNVKNIRNSRRRVTASSKWEDALSLNPGRNLPDRRIDRANSDGILAETEALGGIERASEVLFNNAWFSAGGQDDGTPTLFQNGFDLNYRADTVPPEDVMEELLWQRRFRQNQ